MGANDADDWTLATAGEGAAIGRVFERHRDRIFRHSIRLVPTPSDADDVVAITFFEAWRLRDRAQFVGDSLLPWLLSVATNTARNLSRSIRRYRHMIANLPPNEDHQEQLWDQRDSEVELALRQLSLNHQQILVLCVLEGLSTAEAAAVLQINEGTAKSRLSRAKQRLAEIVTSLSPPATQATPSTELAQSTTSTPSTERTP